MAARAQHELGHNHHTQFNPLAHYRCVRRGAHADVLRMPRGHTAGGFKHVRLLAVICKSDKVPSLPMKAFIDLLKEELKRAVITGPWLRLQNGVKPFRRAANNLERPRTHLEKLKRVSSID